MTLLEIVGIVNLMLTLGICVLMVTIFRQQNERIARLEMEVIRHPPTIIDGQNRMLTRASGFIRDTGIVQFNSDPISTFKVGSQFAGMPVTIYVVAQT